MQFLEISKNIDTVTHRDYETALLKNENRFF